MSIQTILFPSQPYNLKEVDSDFEFEMKAAEEEGFSVCLVDHTKLVNENIVAYKNCFEGETLYRGWMLTPPQYTLMYNTLRGRYIQMINDPFEYINCHYLPYSYPYIKDKTPKSSWIEITDHYHILDICELSMVFGNKPIIVKDFVKSEKHYWKEACFIPCANDLQNVEKVISKLLELRGPDLNKGLVFREYHPLKIIGTHPKSGMPLGAEIRIFWFNHKPILIHNYWEGLCDIKISCPIEEFQSIASKVPSNFFTMDLALKEDGTWIIMELGDGQVSGIPSHTLIRQFYHNLKAL